MGFETKHGHRIHDKEVVIWTIEINTLEDLNAIIAETQPYHGVVYNITNDRLYSVNGERLGEVIIYNGYLE